MTNDELRQLMTTCLDRLKSVYPFPEGSTADPRFAFAIGLAVGVLCEGLDAQREDRPMRVNLANPAMTVRGKIEYDDFAALVSGREVELAGWGSSGPATVKLILADIGFAQMLIAIDRAIAGESSHDDHPRRPVGEG